CFVVSTEKRKVPAGEPVDITPVPIGSRCGTTFAIERAMTSRRNRSISTKVTDVEYDQIVARANPKTVSEWAREILVHASEPVDIEFLLLAEFLALRTIVLNLNFTLAEGGPVPTTEAMRRLIDRADED